MLWAPTGLLCRTQLAGCAVPRHARDVAGPVKTTGALVVVERSSQTRAFSVSCLILCRCTCRILTRHSVRTHLLWKTRRRSYRSSRRDQHPEPCRRMVSTRTAYSLPVFETDSLVGEKAVVQSTEGRRGLANW